MPYVYVTNILAPAPLVWQGCPPVGLAAKPDLKHAASPRGRPTDCRHPHPNGAAPLPQAILTLPTGPTGNVGGWSM